MIVRRLYQALCVQAALTALPQAALAGEYVVKLRDSVGLKSLTHMKSFAGFNVLDAHSSGQLIKVVLSDQPSTAAKQLSKLHSDDRVQYVVRNFKIKAIGSPELLLNDPDFSKQWALEKVRAEHAWKQGVGNRNVIVAVSDTGVDVKHADLKDNIWTNTKEIAGNGIDDDKNGYVDDIHGYDFKDDDADPTDVTGGQNPGHGTHCAGIMGAVGDNETGISGMSQQLSIMPVRFLGADGSGDLMGAVKTIDYATENGAQVISASWGAAVKASEAQPITEAILRAADKGVIFVAAASNDGKNNDSFEVYPANTVAPNMITVAASNSKDGKPTWSNYGTAKVHVAAPGDGIYSTLPNDKYGNLSGTSMATPLVSGLVGLLLSHNDKLSAQDVRAILQASGSAVSIETACNCRVDAGAAVERVTGSTLTIVPQAGTIAPEATLQFSAFGGAAGAHTFASSDESVASIDSNGLLTAKAEGSVQVTLTDSKGATNQSLKINIKKPSDDDDDNGGGGGDLECPLDPQICDLLCSLNPELPWCK